LNPPQETDLKGSKSYHRGRPWHEVASDKPFANEPFGLAGTVYTIQEIKSWREREHSAGRPSELEDFYRAQNLSYTFCEACQSRGINVHPVDWDGDTPLFEQCEICGGTGKLVNPSI
jgi:hypothetical protein